MYGIRVKFLERERGGAWFLTNKSSNSVTLVFVWTNFSEPLRKKKKLACGFVPSSILYLFILDFVFVFVFVQCTFYYRFSPSFNVYRFFPLDKLSQYYFSIYKRNGVSGSSRCQ